MFAAKLSIRACKQTAESVSVMFCLSFAPASYSNNSKAVDSCDCLLRFDVFVPGAFCLLETRENLVLLF